MKRILTLLTALTVTLSLSGNAFASEPDSPGTKLITIQAGYGPGIGAIVSGNIAMANFAGGHLYGGLQLGGDFRHGAATGTRKIDLSLAPRVMLGWNLGRVVEFHVGGLAGIAAQRFDEGKSQLVLSYGGFGGFRLNVSESFALVAEGCYAYPTKYLHIPYGSAGIAIKF